MKDGLTGEGNLSLEAETQDTICPYRSIKMSMFKYITVQYL